MNITTVVRVFETENKTTKENLPCLCTIYSLSNEIDNNVIAVAILAALFIISVLALILVFMKPFIERRIATSTESAKTGPAFQYELHSV